MPIYIYECKQCSKISEVFQNYKDKPLVHCEQCKTDTLYRVIQVPLITSVKKHDSELTTVGDLAQRNRDKFSNDKKEMLAHKHNKYKKKQPKKERPKWLETKENFKKLQKKNPEELKRYIKDGTI